MSILAWIGARAQWALAAGVIAALLIPGPGALLDGTIPFWVALLMCLAMTRVDLGAIARRALAPGRLVRTLALCALLMVATPALFAALARVAGLDDSFVAVLVYTSSGPPLGSATAFCLILGLNAAFALELTVLGAFIAPFSMPIVSRLLLGEAAPVDVVEMTLRLALLIGSAALCAMVARKMLGAIWIEKNRFAFDGFASVCLILFLFPLFQGLTGQILSAPGVAITAFILVLLANLGIQIVSFPVCRRLLGRETGGATALIWGNRNAALALASLPHDPVLTLYVALYQFPMYFTPLVMRPIVGAPNIRK